MRRSPGGYIMPSIQPVFIYGSPANGILTVGDVILGVSGQPFQVDPRVRLAKAITEAEKVENGGKLDLLVWRSEKTKRITLKLPTLGSYSDTAPWACPKSERVLQEGL